MSETSLEFTDQAAGEESPPVRLIVQVSPDVAGWLGEVAQALQASDMGDGASVTAELAAGSLLEQMYLESAFGEDFLNKDEQ